MVGPVRNCGFHAAPPLFQCLTGRTIDQINRDLQASFLCPRNNFGNIRGGVGTVKHLQHLRNHGLHTEGNTRESPFLEGEQIVTGHRIRVSFGGDFSARSDSKNIRCGLQNTHQILRGKFCGRAAAEEHRMQRAPCHPGCFKRSGGKENLGNGIVCVSAQPYPVTEIFGGVRVEVAVPAPHRTERNMHIEAEITALTAPGGGRGYTPIMRRGRTRGLCGCQAEYLLTKYRMSLFAG